MKKFTYVFFSLIFLAVTLIFFITVTLPWIDDPNGGLHRPVMTFIFVITQIAVPGYFLGRAITHDEPYKYTNEFKISMKNKDAEKIWKHRL